ncbi:MAG: serine/threonine-protein kinase [Nocardioides sp.]
MGNKDRWDFADGEVITPELTAVRLLGGGSSYEAWLAFDEIAYALVVVKVVRPSLVEDPAVLRGVRREAAMLARANHPVVVRGLRHVAGGERPHVVLENVDGPRLSTLIRRYGPLQEQQYLPLALDIASALEFFRNVDVVHLDIKPSNIIMGAPARLIDFSVARTGERARALTKPIGTDFYMSPEQADAGRLGGPRPASDVWGLGATLFEAVAGYRPFEDDNQDDDNLEGAYPQLTEAPRSLPDGIPAEVAKAVYAALDPIPENRPLPREFSQALQPVLERQPAVRLTSKLQL